MKGTPHRKGGYNLDRSLLFLRAERHTGPAEPALLRIHLNGRLPLFSVWCKGITHADLHTGVAPGAGLFVKIDMLETHFSRTSLVMLLRFYTRNHVTSLVKMFLCSSGQPSVAANVCFLLTSRDHAQRPENYWINAIEKWINRIEYCMSALLRSSRI